MNFEWTGEQFDIPGRGMIYVAKFDKNADLSTLHNKTVFLPNGRKGIITGIEMTSIRNGYAGFVVTELDLNGKVIMDRREPDNVYLVYVTYAPDFPSPGGRKLAGVYTTYDLAIEKLKEFDLTTLTSYEISREQVNVFTKATEGKPLYSPP